MPVINGRKIEAYVLKEMPAVIFIDILQKDGDCPKNLPAEKRTHCICNNKYMNFSYNFLRKKMVAGGVLRGKTKLLDAPALMKHGINPNDIKQFLEENLNELSYDQNSRTIIYRGDEILELIPCAFILGNELPPLHGEQKKYAEVIKRNPKKLIEECGIKIKKKRDLLGRTKSFELLTSFPENLRSETPPYNQENDLFYVI